MVCVNVDITCRTGAVHAELVLFMPDMEVFKCCRCICYISDKGNTSKHKLKFLSNIFYSSDLEALGFVMFRLFNCLWCRLAYRTGSHPVAQLIWLLWGATRSINNVIEMLR